MTAAFMNRMKKFIYPGPLTEKNITHRSTNAYSLYISLLCFFLLIQIMSFISIFTFQTAYLIRCNKQSQIDLSCLNQAKYMIDHNTRVRMCNIDESNLILDMDVEMGKDTVHFHDYETYIEIQNPKCDMRVYYDDKHIVDYEIIES